MRQKCSTAGDRRCHAHLICPMAVFCPVPTTTALALPAVTTVPCNTAQHCPEGSSRLCWADTHGTVTHVPGQDLFLLHDGRRLRSRLTQAETRALLRITGRSCPGRRPSHPGLQPETSPRFHSLQSRWTAVRNTSRSQAETMQQPANHSGYEPARLTSDLQHQECQQRSLLHHAHAPCISARQAGDITDLIHSEDIAEELNEPQVCGHLHSHCIGTIV